MPNKYICKSKYDLLAVTVNSEAVKLCEYVKHITIM